MRYPCFRQSFLAACCGLAAALTSPAYAGTITDPAPGTSCGNHDVKITQSNSSMVLRGVCGDVVVSGSNNAINIETARSIRVEGDGNSIINETVESLDVQGSNNTLNMTQVDKASVSGDKNGLLGKEYGHVTFTGNRNYVNSDSAPPFEDEGTGNRVL